MTGDGITWFSLQSLPKQDFEVTSTGSPSLRMLRVTNGLKDWKEKFETSFSICPPQAQDCDRSEAAKFLKYLSLSVWPQERQTLSKTGICNLR